ncbi:MAG: sugar nucleotide-binding protein [Robiginitomaculum sp.]|nr:sugar nucleotide-binding protein [Robiginitomaculum sp.]
MSKIGEKGLIGSTGFVGKNLSQQIDFSQHYHSKNINEIRGRSFDLLVCAGAPATMWAANKSPEKDAKNLRNLSAAIQSTNTKKLVLISTMAVFSDVSSGPTESSTEYETKQAYGSNRRELELLAAESCEQLLIVRLPALFGSGLKKNFIFDLLNPIPSFLKPDVFSNLKLSLLTSERAVLSRLYLFDDKTQMWQFDRLAAKSDPSYNCLSAAFRGAGMLAREFTHSDSQFQYYNIDNLSADIIDCLRVGLDTINICSEPLRATDVHQALIGNTYRNVEPKKTIENMQTEHAIALGKSGSFLYSQQETLLDLKAFFDRELIT